MLKRLLERLAQPPKPAPAPKSLNLVSFSFMRIGDSNVLHEGTGGVNDAGRPWTTVRCGKDPKTYTIVAKLEGAEADAFHETYLFDGSRARWLAEHFPEYKPCKVCWQL